MGPKTYEKKRESTVILQWLNEWMNEWSTSTFAMLMYLKNETKRNEEKKNIR